MRHCFFVSYSFPSLCWLRWTNTTLPLKSLGLRVSPSVLRGRVSCFFSFFAHLLSTLNTLASAPGHGWCSSLYDAPIIHRPGFFVFSHLFFLSLVPSRIDEDFSDKHKKKAHAQKPKRKHEPNFPFRLDHWTRVKTYMSRGHVQAPKWVRAKAV